MTIQVPANLFKNPYRDLRRNDLDQLSCDRGHGRGGENPRGSFHHSARAAFAKRLHTSFTRGASKVASAGRCCRSAPTAEARAALRAAGNPIEEIDDACNFPGVVLDDNGCRRRHRDLAIALAPMLREASDLSAVDGDIIASCAEAVRRSASRSLQSVRSQNRADHVGHFDIAGVDRGFREDGPGQRNLKRPSLKPGKRCRRSGGSRRAIPRREDDPRRQKNAAGGCRCGRRPARGGHATRAAGAGDFRKSPRRGAPAAEGQGLPSRSRRKISLAARRSLRGRWTPPR